MAFGSAVHGWAFRLDWGGYGGMGWGGSAVALKSSECLCMCSSLLLQDTFAEMWAEKLKAMLGSSICLQSPDSNRQARYSKNMYLHYSQEIYSSDWFEI